MRSIAALSDASKTSGALRKRHAGRVVFCQLLHRQAEQGCNSKQVPQLRHLRAAAMLTLMLGVLMIGGKADANGKDGRGMATAVILCGVARVGGRTNGRDLKPAILGGGPTGQAISSKINEYTAREMTEVELGMQRAVSLRKQAIGGHQCSLRPLLTRPSIIQTTRKSLAMQVVVLPRIFPRQEKIMFWCLTGRPR